MRTLKATIAGTEHEIPVENGLLFEAEEESGVSVARAIATQRFGLLFQGLVYAYLQRQGVKTIKTLGGEEEPLSYEAIGRTDDYETGAANVIAFMQSMRADVKTKRESAEGDLKNASTEEPQKQS